MKNKVSKKKRVRINSKGIIFLLAVFLVVFLLILGISKIVSSAKKSTESSTENIQSSLTVESSETIPTETEIDLDLFQGIYSQNAVLIDAETGSIIKSLNADTESYPASVTKIMTVLVAIENCDNLNDTYTMPQNIYDYLYYQDLSVAGFERNEEVKIEDLLYGIMMRSGAECCLGVAQYISGSEDAFVTLMNQKAQELGLEHTHFVNCTGEHDDNHYSTVYDMAQILRAGLQNQSFRDIISAHVYTTNGTNIHPNGLTFYSTFDQCLYSYDAGGATMIGAKTGYTSQAGQCLASFAQIDGHEYILVTFGAMLAEGQSSQTSHLHANDAINIYSRYYLYLHNGATATPTPEPTSFEQGQAQAEDGIAT